MEPSPDDGDQIPTLRARRVHGIYCRLIGAVRAEAKIALDFTDDPLVELSRDLTACADILEAEAKIAIRAAARKPEVGGDGSGGESTAGETDSTAAPQAGRRS